MPQFATTAPLRILHRGSFVPRMHEAYRDSVLELLDHFPSPIPTASPVKPGVGRVSLDPRPPSSLSDTPTAPVARASLNSDTSSKINTYQRRSDMPMFSPLFQESHVQQEQGSRASHDEPEFVQFVAPDGLACERGALARRPSIFSSSSQGGVSDIRPRSHWTAEEEALLDEYRCRSVQEPNSDSPRMTRGSTIIFYNPFIADEGEDDEGEEDLPIEALRKRLKLTSTLLPQSLKTIPPVLNSTTASSAQAMGTEDAGLAGIGCGPRKRSHSSFVPGHIALNDSPRSSVRAPSTMPAIVSTTVLSGYCLSVAPPSLPNANQDEPTLKRWTEVPFKEYLPVDFELALGGTSRYPAFPSSPPAGSQFTIFPQSNQPLDRRPTKSLPFVPSSLECNLPSPKLDNPTGYSQKCLSEQPQISNSRRLRNNPNLHDASGVKTRGLTNGNIPPCLPAVSGCREAENTVGNNVQTTGGSGNSPKRTGRAHGASNWRPPTCWEMPGWEPAIELIGEEDNQGYPVTISSSLHRCEASGGSVKTVLTPASDSRAIFPYTPSPSRSSPSLSAPAMSPKCRRSSPLAFIQLPVRRVPKAEHSRI